MSSIYHAYQAYERRVTHGEFASLPGDHKKKAAPAFRPVITYRLGKLLIRTGIKLINHTRAGHTFTPATAAER